jgi:uncharacterized protein (TIGR03435 family)
MQQLDDIVLLREYLERDSEEAFALLVARHVKKVYSVALRHTGNPHSAAEITQVAHELSKLLGVQVTDQTGLADGFDFTLSPRAPAPDDIKAAFLDELGLQSIPAGDNPQSEFLIVGKQR